MGFPKFGANFLEAPAMFRIIIHWALCGAPYLWKPRHKVPRRFVSDSMRSVLQFLVAASSEAFLLACARQSFATLRAEDGLVKESGSNQTSLA